MADEDSNVAEEYLAFAQWFSRTPQFPSAQHDDNAERCQAYRRVFGTPEGLRVLRDMAMHSGLFDVSPSDRRDEVEGARAVVLRILFLLSRRPVVAKATQTEE